MVVLSATQGDIIVFGKGGKKQLGLASTPWLSTETLEDPYYHRIPL